MPHGRRFSLLGMLAAALAAAGCGGEEPIYRYQVPHVDPAKVARAKETQRLLGAIFPQPDKIWFFKVSGPEDAVQEIKEAFDSFIKTVRFTGKNDPAVEWTVPAGWTEDRKTKPGGFRYASFGVPTNTQKLDLSVSPLGLEAGSVLDNVNRWRKQLGLQPTDEAGLKDVTKVIDVAGGKVTLVELPGAKDAEKEPAAGVKPAGFPFGFQPPPGWKQYSPKDGVNLAGFKVQEGNQEAKVTMSVFPEDGGGLQANIGRWCKQVNMNKAQTEEAIRNAVDMPIDGQKATFVDLANPGAPVADNHILGLILAHKNMTWFIKMTGPTELVTRQKATFEVFVRSIRFEGKGGNP